MAVTQMQSVLNIRELYLNLTMRSSQLYKSRAYSLDSVDWRKELIEQMDNVRNSSHFRGHFKTSGCGPSHRSTTLPWIDKKKKSLAKDGSGLAGILSCDHGTFCLKEMQTASKEMEMNFKSLDDVNLRQLDDVCRGGHAQVQSRNGDALAKYVYMLEVYHCLRQKQIQAAMNYYENLFPSQFAGSLRLFESAPAREILRRSKDREDALRKKIDEAVKKQETIQKDLDKEKEKSLCSICYTKPRDTVVLKCMHFQYCSDCLRIHQLKNNRCPTCRGAISAVLKLGLNI